MLSHIIPNISRCSRMMFLFSMTMTMIGGTTWWINSLCGVIVSEADKIASFFNILISMLLAFSCFLYSRAISESWSSSLLLSLIFALLLTKPSNHFLSDDIHLAESLITK